MTQAQSLFQPAWWLKNGHSQTLFPALLRQVPKQLSRYRERFETADGDFFDVDFCGIDQRGPLVILLHGLTGNSQSGYIRGLQAQLQQQGWRSAALNFRGCSGESNRLARCYHSGDTEDLNTLYCCLRQREPTTPIATVGFSLGGNVLLKWLGEQGGAVDVFAAVAVSVPLRLDVCATRLDKGLSRLYRDRLLQELKAYLHMKQQQLSEYGYLGEAEKLQALGNLSTVRSFWQYDDQVVAPLHGFCDVHDYYQRSSSRQFLRQIMVPTLLIQAADDPFMSAAVLPEPEELSPAVTLQITAAGGHVGFVAGRWPGRPRYWLESRIPDFLTSVYRTSGATQCSI